MASIYSNLTPEQIEYLKEYAKLIIKQDVSTTGSIEINNDRIRIVKDNNAKFIDNEVEPGDTIEILQTNPASTAPVKGSYTISNVVDNNTIEFDASVKVSGVNISYRIINTSGLQSLINSAETQLARVVNIDMAEARALENINYPWYLELSNIMFAYFNLYSEMQGGLFAYPVLESDLDAVTQVNPYPLIPSPGPLLYPYGYSGSMPDRRLGAPIQYGTPSLWGIPDTSHPTVPSYSPPGTTSIPAGTKELPAIIAEENFYTTVSTDSPPPPYYGGSKGTYLNSIKTAITNALNNQLVYISLLKSILDIQISDLQSRGITGTDFYSKISAARKKLNLIEVETLFHLNDPTVGVSSISPNTNPATHPRRNYIKNIRPQQINLRTTQMRSDYSLIIFSRYCFLDRRVNRSRGSLSILRSAQSRANDLKNEISALKSQRVAINSIIGGLIE